MGNQCCASEEEGCCETQTHAAENKCPTTAADPFSCGVEMWNQAFRQAILEVQVDILKPKIQKAWGPMMEKVADAAVESMGICWQSAIAQAKSKEDFRTKLQKIWQEGK